MPAGHRAVSVLYQALLTGLVLTLVTRRGEDQAAELVFRLFRRQHLEKFLPGLAKLGLDRLPHAVACAQYHYLSNQVGGVKTEYARESDRKAWVRYPGLRREVINNLAPLVCSWTEMIPGRYQSARDRRNWRRSV